jgi:two-component system OmpR family sensor kinase/two-component system sensor histidine kinase BaeS
VLYDQSGERLAPALTASERAVAVPVAFQGNTVGYLIAGTPGRGELSEGAKQFLTQANTALWQAGLLASALGALLGFLIARQLTAPLSQLANAAHRLAHGQLGERVAVGGTEEVSEVARAFNGMAASLQQAEAVRQNMVADIAHELRTPLSVLQGGLRAILDDVYPMEKQEIAALYDETLLLGRLVSDLRDLAQAEAGHLSLALETAELAPLLEGAVHLFVEAGHERHITLTLDCPPALPRVRMDPARTRQILHNLLSNALRHSPDGGAIQVRASDGGNSVRVEVTDSGSGLAAGEAAHVFERLWRAEPSRSRGHGGSGLGLAIARHLVEAQGGQIGVHSEPGRGSCFWFTLPVSNRPLAASTAA